MDLINFSWENDVIGYSENIFEALKELKEFNYDNIYLRRDLRIKRVESNLTFFDEVRKKFQLIFEKSLNDLQEENYETPVFKDHVEYIDDPNYNHYFNPLKKEKKLTLIARDYIAGMSDKYFAQTYELLHEEK